MTVSIDQTPSTVLYQVVAKEMNTTEAAVRQATSLEELGIDSLEMIEIVMAVEDRLGISINDRELHAVGSMPELLALIERSPKKAAA
nr:acyl carrier protein [Asticcacaulis currens]